MRWRGKKTKAWEDQARPELKKQFDAWGIRACELRFPGCTLTRNLGFAHALKRSRHPEQYRTEDLKRVCLACNNCHDVIEARDDMTAIVDRVIELRWKILSLTRRCS